VDRARPHGALDDAHAHIESLEAAGAHSIGLFPNADAMLATAQLPTILSLAHR
jgi:5,10-methylenetetrahydromethanopterin reductase